MEHGNTRQEYENTKHANTKQGIFNKDIILILIATFFYMGSFMVITPVITGFTGSLGARASMTGIIGGLMNLCALICRPFIGNLADKISKYKLSLIGGVLMAVACFGYLTAASPAVVALMRVINGIGYAACSVCMSTWMANLLPKDKIGSGMGIYGTVNALAMAAAPALGVLIFQTIGYRPTFVIGTVFSISIIVVIQFVGDKGEPELPAETAGLSSTDIKQEPGPHARLEILDINVLPIALIMMMFALPYCATQSFLVSYAAKRHLAVTVSLFFPFYAAVLLVLRLSLKRFFDTLPFHYFLLGSSLSAGAGILSLTFMHNNTMMFFASLFIAGGYGIMCSVSQSTAILLAGEGRRGLANSTYYIGLDLGMTLGPIVGGFLMGNVGARYFYPIFLLTVPAGLLIFIISKMRQRSYVLSESES